MNAFYSNVSQQADPRGNLILASTCLAVLFVPSFFVVLQRFAERKRVKPAEPRPPEREPKPVA